MKYILTFSSTSYAMLAKRGYKKLGGSGEVVSVPRELSTACAYALEIESSEEQLQNLVSTLSEKPGNIFEVEGKGKDVSYNKVELA